MLFVHENPEQAWQELGPYFLREMQEYSSWKVEGVPRPSEDDVKTIDDVRASGRFRILTPAAARDWLAADGDKTAVLHPLAGGVPLEQAWAILRLFVGQVLQPLQTQ